MKILLVSDTHGRDSILEAVLENEKPDFLCHMGDIEGSEDHIRETAKCRLAMIAGNNDFWTDLKSEIIFELQGFRILMTHGHRYRAHAGNEQLKAVGYKNHADIVLFGHTHMPTLEITEDLILANPGSLTYPRQQGRQSSYMVLYLEKGKMPKIETKYL